MPRTHGLDDFDLDGPEIEGGECGSCGHDFSEHSDTGICMIAECPCLMYEDAE